MTSKSISAQINIFSNCETECEAYSECCGFYPTAPCGCAWSKSSGKQYKCNECYIICRERGIYPTEKTPKLKDFKSEIKQGFFLDQVEINFQQNHSLPTYIPYQTNIKYINHEFSSCIAIDLKSLFSCRKEEGAELKPVFKSESDVRRYFNAGPKCTLIAVLNGQDRLLESFWASSRISILNQLKRLGFSICTGPTFSVTALTTEGMPLPQSHNVAMRMRHNRVLSEISYSGMSAIPNLYWVDGDAIQINKWTSWLKYNPEIKYISRDFTSTRDKKTVKRKIDELLLMLKDIKRYVHVLIIGTGPANSGEIVKRIRDCGHEVSIITSAPIMKGMFGSEYFLKEDKHIGSRSIEKNHISRSDLIRRNISIFENFLK